MIVEASQTEFQGSQKWHTRMPQVEAEFLFPQENLSFAIKALQLVG